MATHRSNLPVRLQQILSGGRTSVPTVKLESEPPPKVKAFIDRVIKSPLHDIAIPLSGFCWEYNKGNFHHWRPLFLHFDTYFKTYLSNRKDLNLSDDIIDGDMFPKHSVVQILRVMQTILENCPNKSSFSGLEHFKLLLSSADPDILLAALETLSALVRINPSKLHGSGKLIGCGSLNSYLLSLAQGWGSKEEGLGLFSCVVANEKNQHDGLCLFPLEVDDVSDRNQYRLGSTLHFEFPATSKDDDKSKNVGQSSVCVIHVPDLHLQKEDDLILLKQFVDQYNVPLEHRFSLLTRIRFAHAYRSPRTCRLYSRVCILAFIVLVQSNDAHDELVSFFANEPEYINELIKLVQSEDFVPGTIKALAMLALGAQLAAYTSSHERARVLSGPSVISAGNRTMLLTILQKAIVSLGNQSDPSSVLFVDSLLQFFLLHVLSSSSSGSVIRGSAIVPPLLPLLQDTNSAHVHLVCSAVKTLQKLMEYSAPAVSLFKDLGGVELLAQRLQIEVRRVIGTDSESSTSVVLGDSVKVDQNFLYSQKKLIKILLKAVGSATYSPAGATRSNNSHDTLLSDSLCLIFQNVDRFGGDIYFSAVTVMSEIIHKDPTCFNVLHELGLPDAFLSSVTSGILPSSKALICIPGALGAICLNAKGLEAVKETAALRFLVDIFTSKKYLVAMNEGVVLLSNALEELLRHVSSLRSTGVDIIIEIIDKLSVFKADDTVQKVDVENAMEMDVEDKENRGQNLVDSMDSTADGVTDEQFFQLCIFHVMVLVHRTMENSETCRLFVEKNGIEMLMKLLLQPCIAESTEGTPIVHSTVVFKSFVQHHSAPLARAFCSALRDNLNKALSKLSSLSGALLDPQNKTDSGIFSPLFVIEFLLFLAACKDHRWMAVLLTEFGNGSKDVLNDIGRLHREVIWQISLLEDAKLDEETGNSSANDVQSSVGSTNSGDEQRYSSFRHYIDPLLRRRRVSGWGIESQFLDLISIYRDISRSGSRRHGLDGSTNSLVPPSSQTPNSSSLDVGPSSGNKKESDKHKSYIASRFELMKSLSYHISHLFLELGKAMLLSSRRGSDPVNVSSSAKSVVSSLSSVVLDHLNFSGKLPGSLSEKEISISTKCRYLGKVVDFIDDILLEKPESCNPILMNCFYGHGVFESVLTTFEATSQLLFEVNRTPTSPMEMDDEAMKQDTKEEVDNRWIYGPLVSYGTLMDHLVTSSFIVSSSNKQFFEHPISNSDVPFPRDAEAFVKALQSKVLKTVLPIWNNPRFAECSYDFIAAIISIIKHIYSGVEIRDNSGGTGARITGPPPDESTISLIVEMGFTRARAEEALRQVRTNSVELATDWLFSHPEEPEEDDDLARALKLSLGNSGTSPNEDANADLLQQEMEVAELPPIDELLTACFRLLQANESLAFPVRDLLVMASMQNDGEFREKVVHAIMDQLRSCSSIPESGTKASLPAITQVVALVLHSDEAAREIASKSDFMNIVLALLSQWDSSSFNAEKPHVPKWVTASFLAIDEMLHVNPKITSDAITPESVGKDFSSQQTAVVINETNQSELKSSLGVHPAAFELNDKKKLIEISCKCLKNQLPSETLHVVMQLCATLTRDHSLAVTFLDSGGLTAMLNLPATSLFPGFDSVAATIIRHILEDPHTLQQAMESEIRHSLLTNSHRHSNGRITPRNFVQNLSSVISRDPVVFMQAVKATCQVEMLGERPYIVLIKDRDKDKPKEREKEKVAEREKSSGTDGKINSSDVGLTSPMSGQNKAPDSNSKASKGHRKPPTSFTSVIELLLDLIAMFVPPGNSDDSVGGTTCSPTDMDIDCALRKGKGKAPAVPAEGSKTSNQEASASLAKSVFILKLLTEILMTYTPSIHVLLRRDAEISSYRGSQRCNSISSGGGIFHHILHNFLPHSGSLKKDKRADSDWRQKLATRANQFLVAASTRSAEGRKRILTDANNVFLEFCSSSVGCRAPVTDLHAIVDLVNEMLCARTSSGSYVSSEASATFIDVGLVQSLTRTLQILDLDHADSSKIVTGIVKALELVTKEHALSSDPNSAKEGASQKTPSNQDDHEIMENNSNRFHSLETASQPDTRDEQMEGFNGVQASDFPDSVPDDIDHDPNLDGGFATEEVEFMHEPSESVRSIENGITTVEINFDIPHNMEDHLGDEDDDEDMSGDDAEGDGDEDDDEDDEENNDEDEVHMSHPETDQDEHEIEEEFDEDIMEEEDDDEDDEDGVILRLEEGINGMNVFDHIELFGPGGNNFSNATLGDMPLEVFLGRAGVHSFSHEHPLLTEPSSLRNLVPQRQSENTIDAAFSDRNLENASTRMDAVFRSVRSARQGHRFNMWIDDTRQRGGSNTNAIPQGIEDLLISQLRRPNPDQGSGQNASTIHPQEGNEENQLDTSAVPSAADRSAEGMENEDSPIPSLNTGTESMENTEDVRPVSGDQLPDRAATDVNDQVTDMQCDRSDATMRDMEAISLESGGSSATLGESLRSLDVEIGSVEGHDDGGERQGDLHQTNRGRRSAGGAAPPPGGRDASLESVSEVPVQASRDGDQGDQLENQQANRNNESGPIDPTFLEALPEELRAEVLSAQQNQGPPSSNEQPQATEDIDPEFLAALPPDIRAEVLAQQQAQRLHQSQELEGQPVEMDTVSIIATFPSELREEVLLTSPDAVLASLTPALVQEANMLRERFAHRYHSGGTLFGMYPRSRRGESSRRGDATGSHLDRAGIASRRSLENKLVEANGAPLVDLDALRAMVRLLRVVQLPYKGQLHKLLLNLCAHHETRSSLVRILMDMLMLDVWGSAHSMDIAAEPSYRLYSCQSYISYSRPQFSNGVPPLVSRRVLEALKYLAQHHPNVAKLLLQLEMSLPPSQIVDHSRGKAVIGMEEQKSLADNGKIAFVLLLSLLNLPLYMRSIAHLEQLLNLMDVVLGNVESELNVHIKTPEQISDSSGTAKETAPNSDTVGSSVEGAKSAMNVTTSSVSSEVNPAHAILLNLPQSDLRQLCSLLAREGLSDNAYTIVAEVLKKLVAVIPEHCRLFIQELGHSIQSLTVSAMKELHAYDEVAKTVIRSSTDGPAVLRVLTALSSLLASLHDKERSPESIQEPEHNDVLTQISNLNVTMEPLWLELSNCISRIECSSESISDFTNTPTGSVYPGASVVPPLPMGTQNILPYIESFFVTCEKLHPGPSGNVQDIGVTVASDGEDATTSGSGQKSSSNSVKLDEKHMIFVKFSEKHRKLLNAFIRQNPGLLEKSFSLMLKVPRFIDFDNKRAHFRSKIKHQHDHHHSSLRISVRRAYILEDSYNQLRMRSPQELKGRLTVHFQGEEGIDAGGLTREWYQLLSRVIFDKGALLFTTVGNAATFQPNPNSVYQTEHLSYFKFVGRVVGKALFDGQLLDVHFTRSFYKHILGAKVTYHDIEAIDPDYYKNLKWMLENDISDVLGLTFSIDADEEKLILYEKSDVTDYELIPGGRNIRVTDANKHEYVDLVAEHRLTTAIRPQINAFMEGFNDLVPKDLISIFNDKELELLISGLPDIDLEDLRANTEYSGYSNASPVIQWFWEVVQGFSKEDKARLLQFVTGTSKVPLEGFGALQGISGSQRFQIHKAYGSPDHLPSAHTCFNQLDLPEYPSKEQLQERLLLAIHEANEGFGFG